MRWVAVLFFVIASSATADESIDVREWRMMTEGKTVHYAVDGKPVGREYYLPGENFAIFETPDGRCVEGPWAHTDGRYCFWYGAHFQCYAHVRRDGRIYSRPDTGGREQQVLRIVDNEPLACIPG